MTLLRDLVICNSSGVPDGTADGQYLRWNDSAGEWQEQTVTAFPPESHTHSFYECATGFRQAVEPFNLFRDIHWPDYGGGWHGLTVWRYGVQNNDPDPSVTRSRWIHIYGLVKALSPSNTQIFRLLDGRMQNIEKRILPVFGYGGGAHRMYRVDVEWVGNPSFKATEFRLNGGAYPDPDWLTFDHVLSMEA
jgi:hypothetical protein